MNDEKEVKEPAYFEGLTTAREPQSGAKIRVWRRYDELPVYTDMEVITAINSIPFGTEMHEVVKILSQLERVIRIEMLDKDEMGAIACF